MIGDSSFGDEPCPTCEQSVWGHKTEGQLIPVWEDPEDYNLGKGLDYIGCTNCHTMKRVGADADHLAGGDGR